ncbi:MAG TPA: polysaccharide deacetylase family protein [Chthoniobacteraceae bacterium]|nr:polysaccharide deacetylase family protein [Chthoniobacteraceae bacterium]
MTMQPPAPARALVVSIHDVSPLTLEPVKTILGELGGLGVHCTSLLVVPDHHQRGNFLQDKPFCDWLLARNGEGHEAIIHGYYHQRARHPHETTWQKLMTQAYTAGEGEFYDIAEDAALGLVTKAQQEFASLGLHPRGFIAPAWLLSDDGEQALRKAGIHYTTRLGNVLDLRRSVKHDSASMVYSVRSAWRRALSLPWNAALFDRLKANPLLRISIHPPDLRHPKIWRQITACAARAVKDRTPTTYGQWVDEMIKSA